MLRIQAVFDGNVLRPSERLDLAPNTVVELTVVVPTAPRTGTGGFLDAAENAQLDGPKDWSANLDKYLYPTESGDHD